DRTFQLTYLGVSMRTLALNLSRPGARVVGQYYNFLRLGFDGYRRVQQACRSTARWLARGIEAIDAIELITDGGELPVFAFRLARDVEGFTVFDVSDGLRQYGWQVPAYTMAPDREDLAVLRIVVRDTFRRGRP